MIRWTIHEATPLAVSLGRRPNIAPRARSSPHGFGPSLSAGAVLKEMNIRPYRTSDLAFVVQIFTEAVHELAAGSYDNEQRSAWAPKPPDSSHWQRRLKALQTIVAELKGEPVGFLSYEADGHIDLLYTAPAYARRGVATALYRHAENILLSSAIAEIFTANA